MRFWSIFSGTITAVAPAAGVATTQAQSLPAAPQTFAVETYVARGYNYLDNMVDAEGLPYFDVFWTEPAEAAHDWPDLGDVMARQWQTAIMARHLTGRPARHEKLWAAKLVSLLDPKTGLLVQPNKPFWHSDDPQDERDMSIDLQSFTLYALVTGYAETTIRPCARPSPG